MTRRVNVVIEAGERGFIAWCPQLSGCQTEGRTYDEALVNIREVALLALDRLTADERSAALSHEILNTYIEVPA